MHNQLKAYVKDYISIEFVQFVGDGDAILKTMKIPNPKALEADLVRGSIQEFLDFVGIEDYG